MTYIVTEVCINCKHTDCVQVCPVDCFREGPNFIAIAPDECVDCGLCAIECPLEAIVSESELTENQLHYIALNKELALRWPRIVERKSPMSDAEKWAKTPGKLKLLVR